MNHMTSTSDPWLAAQPYERYMGRWSRRVAGRFVSWLSAPTGLRWLDIGCGMGALSDAVLRQAAPASVWAIDSSEAFIRHLDRQPHDERIRYQSGDAQHLPLDAGIVDVAVSGLMLNFVADPAAALQEARRVTRPGGLIGCYVWDYAGRLEMLRVFWDCAITLDPQAAALDEGRRFPLCTPPALRHTGQQGGLADVLVEPLEIEQVFTDFDDFWTPFLGGQGPAPSYVSSLAADRRLALRDLIRSRLPIAENGTLTLMARVWAMKGSVRSEDG